MDEGSSDRVRRVDSSPMACDWPNETPPADQHGSSLQEMPLHVLSSKFEAPLLAGCREYNARALQPCGEATCSPKGSSEDDIMYTSHDMDTGDVPRIVYTARQMTLLQRFRGIFEAMSKADNPSETLLRWLCGDCLQAKVFRNTVERMHRKQI